MSAVFKCDAQVRLWNVEFDEFPTWKSTEYTAYIHIVSKITSTHILDNQEKNQNPKYKTGNFLV